MPRKGGKEEDTYVVHGIRYLSNKSNSSKSRKSSRNRSPGDTTDGRRRNHSSSIYVSSDWTDHISLSNVDWANSDAYPYENIVMSGGGSKGYAFIGALKVQGSDL